MMNLRAIMPGDDYPKLIGCYEKNQLILSKKYATKQFLAIKHNTLTSDSFES